MKIKTSELTGPALCYAVTMIEMPTLVWGETIGIHHASHQIVVPSMDEPDCYSPFSDWKMCGPIIEREKFCAPTWGKLWKQWEVPHPKNAALCINGPTPLIAAMRCFVASRLGDKVEIPEELI